jgi:hypothetical protein
MKRFASLFAAAGAVAVLSGFALAGGASGAPGMQTLTITESGTTGISLSDTNPAEGAVNVVATHTGAGGHAGFGLVRLNPNVSPQTAIQQGFGAIQSAHGNLDALTATGSVLFADANAPGAIQVYLTPGDYIALNTSGNGQPAYVQFKVHSTGSPAALPAASSTQTAIEFGFRGSKKLKNGTIVRAQNHGYLVHMIQLIGVKGKASGNKVVAGLRRGEAQKKLRKYLNGGFVSLQNPVSPGAMQQMTLHAKRGYYVEACFMDTQDGREHTRLGMERLVKIVK